MPSVLDPPDVKSWDRQLDEPPNAWFAFRLWRDRKPRPTYATLADELDLSQSRIGSWASDWFWKIRAVEYDRMVDSGAQEAVCRSAVQEVEDMRRQHLQDASGLRSASKAMLGRLDETRPSLQAAVRALDVATRLERLTMGQPTDIPGQVEPDYSTLTDEEFKRLGELLDKAEGKS